MSNNLLLNAAVTKRRGRVRALAGALAVTMVASLVTGSTPAVVSADKHPMLRPEKVIPHVDIPLAAPRPEPERPTVKPVSWPAVGEAVVALDRDGGERQAGSLPVRLRANGSSAEVRVKVLSKEHATKAGVSGVITTLAPAGGGVDSVTMDLDYAGFANAGANFGTRLTLVTLPRCVLDTPEKPECQVQTPLKARNDVAAQRVNATVALTEPVAEGVTTPSSYGAPGFEVVVASVAESSGPNGTFAASSLSPAGTWSMSGNSGSFSWSYPIAVPPSAAGPAPSVGLSYSSSSVDGLTSGTNNQSSWVGLGWAYSPGFVERTFRTCSEDTTLTADRKTPDLCWVEPVVTLNLGGRSTPLVLQNGAWRPESDDGEKVELKTDAPNGARGGEHWKITTVDGTEYWFGRDSLPGTTTQARTNSAWTVPVTHPTEAGHQCQSGASLALPECAHAWRWNLDYVRDRHGSAAAYYYEKETNRYGANNATTAVAYTRGGWLKRIDYGLRETGGSIYGSAAPNLVEFNVTGRCTEPVVGACDSVTLTTANDTKWPDVPVDQKCDASPCNAHGPSFWSTKRLSTINTYYNASGVNVKVDSYALNSSMDNQNEPSLLLNSITHTGFDSAGGSISTPPVSFFYAQARANRVKDYGGMPPMMFPRISNVRSETGAEIMVSYTNEVDSLQPACTKENVPTDLPNNLRLCYPVYRTLPYNEGQALDFFHKYVVDKVEVQDVTGGSPNQVTAYAYANPGWHYDDNELVKPTNRTYGQFRGFTTVETRSGITPEQRTWSKSTYFRGMHGDTLTTGTRTATVTNTLGESVNDRAEYAGMLFETQTFDGDGGARLSRTISDPITITTTASRTRTPLPAQVATITGTARTREITEIPAGGTRTATTHNRYDSTGRLVAQTSSAQDLPDLPEVPNPPDLCATTDYANHATIKNLVSQTTASTGACPPAGDPQTSITGATRTFYDGSTTLGAVPGAGNATRVDTATSLSGGQPVYQTTGSATFDASGRVLSATDARNRTATTAYTPELGGIVSKVVTTNAKDQSTTVALAPGRGTPLTVTDVAGRVAQARYDQLGRVVEMWQPGRDRAAQPNVKYEYLLRNNGPLAVTTRALVDNGVEENYLTSVALFDSLGRQRQTQAEDMSGGGNRVVSDVFYDSHGWQTSSNNRYLTTGPPGTNLAGVSTGNVDDRTVTTYDGAGRPTVVAAYKGNTKTREVRTVYGGDRVTTIPPQGGVPSTVISDARGRTTELVQYTTAPTISGTTVSGGNPQSTKYAYNLLGQLDKLTNEAGTQWGFEYDFLGRQTARVDPDAGRSTTAYDLAGQITSTTDALNQTLSYVYDDLGRKTASWVGAPDSGVKLATWAYDTAANGVGKLHSSTRHTTDGDYTVKTTGYNGRGLPFDQITTIPANPAGFAGSYKTQFGYTSTNLPTYVTPAHAGGLPGENIQFTYDRYGQPQSTRGVNMIVAASTYSSAGEPLRYALGGLDQVALTFDRDTHTHRVNQITMTAIKAVPQIDDVQYTHDPAGNLTKAYNTQGHPDFGGVKRTECFAYDGLNRLTEAWTSATANTCAATPGAGTVGGGVTPYWTSWEFNKVGSRTKQTQHQIAGGFTGDTTTMYAYATPGHAHAVSSTATTGPLGDTSASYLYDAVGNTDKRVLPTGTQDLSWDKTGRLVNVDLTSTTPTNDSSYVYDADGNQLIRTEPGKTTLYLPGQEITRNTTNGAVTGTRYYTHNGTTVAVRNTGENPTYLKADMHGTNQVAVASNNYAVTRRTLDPYGNPLGTEGTTPWPDNRGFLNKPTNTTTGLTDIGARNYDPTLGAFISVDPILDMANPQSWTGYAYAGNNPTTFSDPSGLTRVDALGYGTPLGNGRSFGKPAPGDAGSSRADHPIQRPKNGHAQGVGAQVAWAKDTRTFSDAFLAASRIWTEERDYEVSHLGCSSPEAPMPDRVAGSTCGYGFLMHANMFAEVLCEQAGITCAHRQSGAARTFLAIDPADLIGGNPGVRGVLPNRQSSHQPGTPGSRDNSVAAKCSFDGDTSVLMGDGATKPIQDVKPGDHVMAADPETGRQGPREVTATWPHTDTVYELVLSDGSVIDTTEDHPFWNATDQQWQRADELDSGDQLATSDGRTITVHGITPNSAHYGRAYNLTVDDIHTYYVLERETAVLVHNANCGLFDGDGWQHVLRNHVKGSPGVVKDKTTFSDYLDLDDIGELIMDTANTPGRPNVPDAAGRRRDGTIHTLDFRFPVGSRGETRVEVILNPDQSLRTAYPR